MKNTDKLPSKDIQAWLLVFRLAQMARLQRGNNR